MSPTACVCPVCMNGHVVRICSCAGMDGDYFWNGGYDGDCFRFKTLSLKKPIGVWSRPNSLKKNITAPPNSWEDQKQHELCDLWNASLSRNFALHCGRACDLINFKLLEGSVILWADASWEFHSSSFQGKSFSSEKQMFYSETPCLDILRNSSNCGCMKQDKCRDGPSRDVHIFQFLHDNSSWDIDYNWQEPLGKGSARKKSLWPWLNRDGKEGQRKWRKFFFFFQGWIPQVFLLSDLDQMKETGLNSSRSL